jgi:uncharacterized tellurite resistance protein B-like protein
MPKPSLILQIAKVLVAAAWADGELTHNETNSLKDLLFQIPQMSAQDWAKLEIYVDSPVLPDERQQLLEDLQQSIRTSADRALALDALDSMMRAAGAVPPEAQAVYTEIQNSIHEVGTSVFSQISKSIGASLRSREAALQDLPDRERQLDDFIKNRIYFRLQRQVPDERSGFELQDREMRKISLAGGLLARVAHADAEVKDDELRAICKAIQRGWSLPEELAELVGEVALSTVGQGMDFYRLTREFFLATSKAERASFLDVLFNVAASDGELAHREVEEIRMIANGLKLTHKQFIAAKLRATA